MVKRITIVDRSVIVIGEGAHLFLESGTKLSAHSAVITPKLSWAQPLVVRDKRVHFTVLREPGGVYLIGENHEPFSLVCFSWVIFTVEHVPP